MSAADWNPALYRRFEEERTRPARELLARVPIDRPRLVYDLGCGAGNSTELLVARFPSARVIGTDNSEAMLASARERLPAGLFELSNITTWAPDAPPDVIYSNAAFQWVGGHAHLIPRLFASLAPGGVLAFQMPDNHDEPTHRAMRELAAEAPFASHATAATAVRAQILDVGDYYDALAETAATVDIWRTAYHHPMASPAAIVEWVRATGLRPFLQPLPADLQVAFLAAYEARITPHYAPRTDGKRLLAFPRLFVVAKRA